MTPELELPTEGLHELAKTLADWVACVSKIKVYLFGSRVRGDHRPDSDVDVCLSWKNEDIDQVFMNWWAQENDNLFIHINARLPGRLEILEFNDSLKHAIFKAHRVYKHRNVECVILPPKLHPKMFRRRED